MTRADPRAVPVVKAPDSSGRSMPALLAALALLLSALAGAVGHAPNVALPTGTHVVATASPGAPVPGPVTLPPASGHPMQPVTWLWSIPVEQVPAAVLLVSHELGAVADDPTVAAVDAMVSRVPLRRAGRPVEVARMALFLASDEASYCTGMEFVVDGGSLAGMEIEGRL